MDGTGRIALYVDDFELEAEAGERLVDVLDRHGVAVEHVCYHPALGPIQTCDTCYVEVEGELRRSCATLVHAGMHVRTTTPRAAAVRAEGMQRLLAKHDLYCTVCDNNNGDCEVHNATKSLGIEHQRYPFTAKPYEVDDSNPFYRYDPDQCILCGRCVEACQNVQVTETLSIDWGADRPRVLWDGGSPIDESSCVSCGHCVTVCPCNALMEKGMLGEAGLFTGMPRSLEKRSIDIVKAVEPYTGFGPIYGLSETEEKLREADVKRTKTVCTYCGVGCSFEIWTKERKVLKVNPVADAPANGISTCVKGKFGWDFVNSEERLTRPLIRDGRRLPRGELGRGARARHPAVTRDPRRARPRVAGLHRILEVEQRGGVPGAEARARRVRDQQRRQLLALLPGPGDQGAVPHRRVRRRLGHDRRHRARRVGADGGLQHPRIPPRAGGQDQAAAQALRPEAHRRGPAGARDGAAGGHLPAPATPAPIWCGCRPCRATSSTRAWADATFLEAAVNGLEEYRASLEPYTLEHAEEVTGIPADTLKRAAEMIAGAQSVVGLLGHGRDPARDGLRHLDRHLEPAAGDRQLRQARHGRLPVARPQQRAGRVGLRGHGNTSPATTRSRTTRRGRKFAKGWGVELPTDEPGLDNSRHDRRPSTTVTLHALYVVGEELALVDANVDYVMEGLAKVDFLVVQEMFFSRTASSPTSCCRRRRRSRRTAPSPTPSGASSASTRAMEPIGEARPDWEILQDIADHMGYEWGYTHPSQIMDEAARLTPMFAGVSYDRLEGYAEPGGPSPRTARARTCCTRSASTSPTARRGCTPVEFREPHELPDDEYTLHVNNGRVLEHFHEGNMTWKVPGIVHKVPDKAFVEVSRELAGERGLRSGDLVRLTSRRDFLDVTVQVSDRVRGHELYMPHNSRTQPVNLLTSGEVDPDSSTPAYKECAVKMEPLGEHGDVVLGKHYHRDRHPTPQTGVRVDRKWQRADYAEPTAARPPAGRPEGGKA